MLKYAARRLLVALIVFLLVTIIVFLFTYNYQYQGLGPYISSTMIQTFTKEDYDIMLQQSGWNDPLIMQYFNFLADIFKGNLGQIPSYIKTIYVSDIIFPTLPFTLYLCLTTLVVNTILGAYLLSLKPLRNTNWLYSIFKYTSNLFTSFPVFLLAILSIFGLYKLDWLPEYPYDPSSTGFIVFAYKWIFPLVFLVIVDLAYILFFHRNSTMPEFKEMYSFKQIYAGTTLLLVKRTLPHLGFIFYNCFFIEITFGIPGLTRLFYWTLLGPDYFMFRGTLLMIGAIMITVSFFSDVLFKYFISRSTVLSMIKYNVKTDVVPF